MKKTVIASLAVLATAATLATFALAGAGKFGDVQVNADPKEYSVTFDESNNTTVEAVGTNYAICTTTAAGSKVGVVGYNNDWKDRLSFRQTKFKELKLADYSSALEDADANEFSQITGLAVTFTGNLDLWYEVNDENVQQVLESGVKYDVSLEPYGWPRLTQGDAGGTVTISSFTIWYSC